MKNMIFLLYPILLLVSCNRKENTINIAAQSALMKEDPVSIEYFEALAASAKIMSEGGLNLNAYQTLMKQYNQDVCGIKKAIFNGDMEMENFVKTKCRIKIAATAFHNKYPFIQGLSKDEKGELFAPLIKRPDYNMEKVKQNAGKHSEN